MNTISVNNYSQLPYTNSYSPYWQGGVEYPYYNQNREERVENPAKTLGLAALLQAVAVGLQKGSEFFAKKLEAGKEFTSAENVNKIADSMIKSNKLDVTVDFIDHANKYRYSANPALYNEIETVANGKNAFYLDEAKLAVAPKTKPSLILHELGHASNSKNFILKMLQKSRRYAMAAPMVLLIASKLLGKREDGQKNFIERNAFGLGFAAFLPTIIEEGTASLKGINAIKKVPQGVLKGAVNKNVLKRNYLLALATYVIAGLGLGVASKQTIIENS